MPPKLLIMKKLFLFSALLLSLSAVSQSEDVLTNDVIIQLHKAGFSKDIIKSKILNSLGNYDVSINGLLKLKNEGVHEEIINAMISNPKGVKSEASLAIAKSGAKYNLNSGLHYKLNDSVQTEIEPSILTSTKTKGVGTFLGGGLVNTKLKASLSGKQSSLVIYEKKPIFIFVFDSTVRNSLNRENSQWITNTRSPKEFILVELDVEKNSREITIGKANMVNSNMGIEDKDVLRFTATKVSNGIYEVTPEKELKEGEYCFMFSQGIKQGESSRVFDFSIRSRKGF